MLAAAALGLSVVLAACGGGSSSVSSKKSTKSGAAPTTTVPGPATLMAANSSLGMILVNAQGKTLYALDKDTATMATCTGGCAGLWPPLTVTGTPVAGSGVNAAMLTVLNGANGMQVVYSGHPLYMFSQDMAPGDVKGQNFAGGIWHVVSPSGQPITTSASSPPSSAASSGSGSGSSGGMGGHSSGGYGY